MKWDNPQENVNDPFHYYHNFYLTQSGQNSEKLIHDLLIANVSVTKSFKLDYVIYSENLEKFRKKDKVVFSNKKYVVKEVN